MFKETDRYWSLVSSVHAAPATHVKLCLSESRWILNESTSSINGGKTCSVKIWITEYSSCPYTTYKSWVFSLFKRGSDTDIYRYIHTCGISEKWLPFSSSFSFSFYNCSTFQCILIVRKGLMNTTEIPQHTQVLGCYAPSVSWESGKKRFFLLCL